MANTATGRDMSCLSAERTEFTAATDAMLMRTMLSSTVRVRALSDAAVGGMLTTNPRTTVPSPSVSNARHLGRYPLELPYAIVEMADRNGRHLN